jgi:ADP-ribose pyrophosphatase YjhB (NUDIX family)
MISFHTGSHRFHLRAGALVIDGGHVLLHRLEGDTFWALPGGRVHAGEQGRETIVRELLEELGLAVQCQELACVGENFFEYEREPHHEIGLYFRVSLPPDAPINDRATTHVGVEGDRRLEFRWFALPSLHGLDFRPVALRDALATGTVPAHFVQA